MCAGEQPHSNGSERPLLTLAVPTYNRAACLRELLTLLANQVKDEPRIELVVSDNASSDETPAVIDEFAIRGVRIRYIRNSENIGADANFLQCFEQAKGKYVWLFSDDDLIIPGALAKILCYCENQYDLISVAGSSFAQFHNPRIASSRHDAVEIRSAREYAKRVHIFFTFISGNVINKDTVLAATPKPFSSLIGSSLAQLGWTYTALNHFTRGLYIHEKLIAVRANNTGGYKLFQVFGPTLASITTEWLNSSELAEIVLNGALQRFWPLMLREYKRNSNLFAPEVSPQDVLTPIFGGNVRYWIFDYPLMTLPSPLDQIWFTVTRIVNRMDRAAGYPLLEWGVARNRWPDTSASRANTVK